MLNDATENDVANNKTVTMSITIIKKETHVHIKNNHS